MFPLFELAKLLNFSQETQKTEQALAVRQIAWKEVGDRSFLALLISNDYILLRYATHGSVPVVRQLPWHPDRPIQAMTFDPSATWLLCVTQKDVLYVIPALALLDSRAQIEQLWKLDDITRIRHRKRRGQPTCLTWWRTYNGDHVAIVGTKLGYVLFIDLQTERLVSETDVSEHVSNIDILHDDKQTVTHALITTKSNSHWKMLIETRDEIETSDVSDGFTPISISVLQVPESRASEFTVRRFQQFSISTFLTPASIQGRTVVSARDLHTKQLMIYDTTLERSPLSAFVVPEVVDEVVVSDRILIFSSRTEASTLDIVASRLDGALPVTDQEEFNSDSIIQRFHLDPVEHILAIFKRTFPFYWHEKREEERERGSAAVTGTPGGRGQGPPPPAFHISSHTVLDGCIVVTTHNVYECRPRVSPESLFVELAVTRSDHMAAEALSAALDLNVKGLYYLAAKHQLSRHDYAQASRFFQLAKSPHLQRVGAFAEYGRTSEVVLYLRQTLDCKRHELKPTEVGDLSDIMVLAYVQQLLEDKSKTNQLTHDLREFLKINTDYSTRKAIDTLVNNGFYEIALEMAKVQNCLYEVLEHLVSVGGSSGPSLEDGLHSLSDGKLGRIRHSSLLKYLHPGDLVRMIEEQPSFAMDFLGHFQAILDDLDLDILQKVTRLFDISLPPYRKLITRSGHLKNSERDMTFSSEADVEDSALPDDMQDVHEDPLKLVEFFTRCVILLNGIKGRDIPISFTDGVFTPLYIEDKPVESELQYRLSVRRRLLSAGLQHSALIHDEQLRLWGDCFTQGRLQGDTDKQHADLWRPFTPLAFRTLRVMSVSCGAHHSMAITEDGVYGWGDGRYGQLGVGPVNGSVVGRPRRVEGLTDLCCVDVVCGAYHTVSLMEDCSVCTWGWGIHGQLGRGSADDSHLPGTVAFPEGTRVSAIAAGYAHTLLLTETVGHVYGFGSGIFGQLGLGTTCKYTTPQHINSLPERVISIATKDFHCLAVTSDSRLYQWGASPSSLCDMVKDHRQNRPRAPPAPVSLTTDQQYLRPAMLNACNVVAKIVQVECGSNFSALVTENGEVFTWGKNYDGQLGIGNRTDQKNPVMVNRINDRKMAAVACGADHMVVMDTEHQVWSWGRNDLGQLAVVTSQGSSTPGGQGIYVSMGIYAAVWPTKVPSVNKITCGASRCPPLEVMSSVKTGQYQVTLPKLVPYTCEALFTLLQNLPDCCETEHWLQQCIDRQLWVTAGSLALRQGALPIALHCHLAAISRAVQSVKSMDTSIKETQMVSVAQFYLSQLGKISTGNRNVPVQNTQDIICQIGEAWVQKDLEMTLLTNLLSEHLQLVAWPLFLLMIRSTPHRGDVQTENKDDSSTSLTLPPKVVSSFDVQFSIQVTSTVIALLRDGEIPAADAADMCSVSLGDGLGLLPRHRMISAEKLWEEIHHNLHKEQTEAQTAITLSAPQMEALTAATAQPGTSPTGAGKSPAAVLFSCGHHLPRRTLVNEAVPQLELDLAQVNMPQSAALLGARYSQKGLMSLACPQCVLNSIRTS